MWTDEKHRYLVHLKSNNYTWKQIAEKMSEKFNEHITVGQCRGRWRRSDDKNKVEGFTEQHEILSDGKHSSTKLLSLNDEQKKDENYLLKMHGYSPDEWAIHKTKSSLWNQNSKEHGMLTLVANNIIAKKRSNEFDWNRLTKALSKLKPVPPVRLPPIAESGEKYLNIPLFDLHFGPADFNYYKPLLSRLHEILETTYTEILIIVGQDLLHNDNFKGETANGTVIDKYDMEKMWEDARTFYHSLITKALQSSPTVHVMFSKGNHDESMGWAFVKMLESEFRDNPRAKFDTSFKERKAILLGTNFLGTTHGDKNRKNIASNFSVEFPDLWAKATTREIYMGHLHRKRVTKTPTEIVLDEHGVIVRELGTGNVTDDWHNDRGYTLAHKEFEVFEYSKERKQHIYYI